MSYVARVSISLAPSEQAMLQSFAEEGYSFNYNDWSDDLWEILTSLAEELGIEIDESDDENE